MQVPEIPNLIYYAIPVFILSILLEVIITTKKEIRTYELKDASSSIAMGLGNVFLNLFGKAIVLGAFFYIYDHFRIFTIPFTWWAWILIFFAEDFTYYWFHRISHENRFFWASHVVHHAVNPQYLDRNHAGILIIWDKIFGTFEEEKEKPVYGLVTNINTYNPVKIAFLEWISLFKDVINSDTSLGNKLKYFIKPPGWKHDGTGLLSSDLRKQWELES